MNITVEIFDKICRVCLTQTPQIKSLFLKQDGEERNLFDILSFTTNVTVQSNDGLPKQVCEECESLMYKAYQFKRRYLESETLLNNICQSATQDDKKFNNNASKVSIKYEQQDINDGLSQYHDFGEAEATSSKFKNDYDKNDVLHELDEFSIIDTSDNKNEIPLVDQPDKQEAIDDFDDDHHDYDEFPVDFNDTQSFGTDSIDFTADKPIKTEENTYKCICGLQFTSQVKYTAHSNQKHCHKYKRVFEKLGKIDDIILLNNRLKCSECDREFNHPNKLITHQRSAHKKSTDSNEKSAQLTQKSTPPTRKLVFITKEDEVHQCTLCTRSFKTKKSLTKHVKRHPNMDNNRHECEICKRVFKYKAFLDNHKATRHTKHNSLICQICTKIFPNEDLLKEHRESHQCEKKHQCNICNRAFGMLCTLKEHMRTHTGEKPFLCSECGKGFSQKTNLGQHMRRHQGLKPFKCENCEKRFVSKGELEAHSRKHSGAHPFVCDDCGNGFTTSSALVKHRRIHTGERPYLCDLCPMTFAASGTLKNHRRIHTGERPFQCVHCDKAFVQRNDLISHIRCHTGEKPYICTQCGQSFRKASGLKTHVKMHVKEPVAMIHHGVKEMLSLNCDAMKDGYAAINNYVPKIGE